MYSRVARSNIWATKPLGIKVILCSPPALIAPGFREMLKQCGLSHVAIEHDLDTALKDADVIMPLRLQKERQQGGLISSTREYIQHYQLTRERLSKAHPGALVMHPGPINEGVEISNEVAYSTQSLIEEQVTNGVAIRMALLYLIASGKGH